MPHQENTPLSSIVQGDDRAFERLVSEYQSMVYTVCYRILGDPTDAEDAAQETFISFYRKAKTFRGDAKISTWLYRIATNKSLSYLRKRKWKSLLDIVSIGEEYDGKRVDPPADHHDRPDTAAEIKQQRAAISQALGKLQDKQRIAFILHKYQGLGHKEVAEIMQLSHSAVESLIFRAKKALQKHLAETPDFFSNHPQDIAPRMHQTYVRQEEHQ